MICDTIGCTVDASWRVFKGNRSKNVCSDCRDGLIELSAWTLDRSLFKGAG